MCKARAGKRAASDGAPSWADASAVTSRRGQSRAAQAAQAARDAEKRKPSRLRREQP
jgi:hypothetical protein